MKKFAISALEVLIAMSLIVAASVLCINTLHIYINKDTDVAKFKHAFSTLSEVIYSLKTDTSMYPKTTGFAYLDETTYANENRSYGGEDKFQKLFMSKFNVYKNDLDITYSDFVPLIKIKDGSGNIFYNKTKKVKCFIENKGFMFCPPKTTFEAPYELVSIFIPLYVNKIDLADYKTTDIKKAIFVEVSATGKIELQPVVKYEENKVVIDCTNKDYNKYSHCKVLDKMLDMDF